MPDRLVSNGVAVSGPTTQRPTNAEQGHMFYDTTIGNVVVQNDGSGTGSPTAGYHGVGVMSEVVTFQAAGEGTVTGSVSVPAGASILDIIVDGVTLWNAATSATMIVGDVADPNGYFDAINLKATDLLAGESISFALAGGKAGAYIANSQVSPRYSATARTISGVVTQVGTGTTGLTRMTVIYTLPRVKAATFAE